MWDQIKIVDNEVYHFRIGLRELWIRKRGHDWFYAHQIEDGEETTSLTYESETDKPEDLVWNRVVAADDNPVFRLRPRVPDRPVVVHVEGTLRILPGCNSNYFCNFPIWIAGICGSRNERELFEMPSEILSNTWFGGAITGVLSYSTEHRLEWSAERCFKVPNHAVCPILVRNASRHYFDVKSIVINTENMNVYRELNLPETEQQRFWTNEAIATFSGEEEFNSTVNEKLPSVTGRLELIGPSRTKAGEGLFKKSLILLRNISNF